MKKSNFVKFALLTVVLALIVGVFAGLTVSADENSDQLDYAGFAIDKKNLEYDALLNFAFTVTGAPELAEGQKIGVAAYAADTAISMEAEYVAITYTIKTDGNVTYYTPHAVEARNIGVTFTFVPVVLDAENNIVGFGETYDYSVAEYCNERIGDLDKIVTDGGVLNAKQENQKVLYNAIIAYGVAAGAVIK